MSKVSLAFQCRCRDTNPGDAVYVVGGAPSLGEWNPKVAVPLDTSASTFPLWKTHQEVTLPLDRQDTDHIEYKYIIKGDGGTVRWEPIQGNRTLTFDSKPSGGAGGELVAASPAADTWGTGPFCTPLQLSAASVVTVNGKKEGGKDVGYRRDDTIDTSSTAPSPSATADAIHTPSNANATTLLSRFHDLTQNNGSKPVTTVGGVAADVDTTEPEPTPSMSPISKKQFIVSNRGNLEDAYVIKKKLGQGSWGSVYEVTAKKKNSQGNDLNILRAVKKIAKCYVEDVERFRLEIQIMREIDHPNVIRLYETFEDDSYIYLVLELCQGGELFDRLLAEGTFSEVDACRIMRQILASINFLHSQCIAHRDIKPENFLFLKKDKDSPLKLIDFGLAKKYRDGEQMTTRAGTPYYVSPQVLEGMYGPECDEWSAGVIMYILLCGYPPFNAQNDAQIMKKVRQGTVTFHDNEWAHVSDAAKDLIRQLLTKAPWRRITSQDALQHPWFSQLLGADTRQTTPMKLDVIGNFRRFQGLSRLKKIALTVIAQQLNDDDIAGLKEEFINLDTDNKGILSCDEIKQGLIRSGVPLPPDLDKLLEATDSDGNGTIDYTEFLAACINQSHYIHEEACRAAFRVFDIDGNGLISAEELRHVFELSGEHLDAIGDGCIADILREADTNGDGEISFDEFVSLLKRVPNDAMVDDDSAMLVKKVASRPICLLFDDGEAPLQGRRHSVLSVTPRPRIDNGLVDTAGDTTKEARGENRRSSVA